MDYKESSTKIYYSKEYSLFKIVKGNRDVSDSRVNRIISDIEKGIDVLALFPILVQLTENKFEIYDGQHRYFVAKKLGKPVHFIIMPAERSMYEIAAINSNTAKWKTKDYLDCYIEAKNTHYVEFRNFVNKYGLSTSLSMRLLVTGTPTGGLEKTTEEFKRGLFEIKKLSDAVTLCENCNLFSFFVYYRSTSFITAIFKIQSAGMIDITELAVKVDKYKEELTKQDSPNEYIGELAKIWNKGKKAGHDVLV